MSLYELLDNLSFGDEHDGTLTSDGWEVFTWMTNNRGAGFYPCEWMQVQIENNDKHMVIIRNDIECQEELDYETEDIKFAIDKFAIDKCHKV